MSPIISTELARFDQARRLPVRPHAVRWAEPQGGRWPRRRPRRDRH